MLAYIEDEKFRREKNSAKILAEFLVAQFAEKQSFWTG